MVVRARESLLVWAADPIWSVPHRGSEGLWEDNKIQSRHRARSASVGQPRGAVQGQLGRWPQDQREYWARQKNEGVSRKPWGPPRKRGHLRGEGMVLRQSPKEGQHSG